MRWRHLLLVLALVATGCTQSDLTLDLDGAAAEPQTPTTSPVAVVTDPDEIVDLALADLQRYWDGLLPDLYGLDFAPLEGGFIAYGPTGPIPECGSEEITYDDIADNALYCPADDLIAWDRVSLIPALQEQFGSLTIGLVMAHEYAHAVQSRADVLGATVTLELQADCFAGAWVGDVSSRIATFSTDADALDSALAGLLELRDSVGVSAADPAAHGTGFDRVSAFQTGIEGGPEPCVAYEDDPPPVVAIPFLSANDRVQGGNLAIDLLIEPLVMDLESFFGALVTDQGGDWDEVDALVPVDPGTDTVTCGDDTFEGEDLVLAGFYCVTDDAIYLDFAELVPALDEIGDFAFGGELARLYAQAAQAKLGLDGDDLRLGLHADCLTGIFAAAEFAGAVPDQQLALSPGDLDEIVIAFLVFGSDIDVTAFERTASFRTGFFGDAESCDLVLG